MDDLQALVAQIVPFDMTHNAGAGSGRADVVSCVWGSGEGRSRGGGVPVSLLSIGASDGRQPR